MLSSVWNEITTEFVLVLITGGKKKEALDWSIEEYPQLFWRSVVPSPSVILTKSN